MTDEEIDRFALVLKECERTRALIAREEAAFSNGEHEDGMPRAAAPPEQRPPVLLRAIAARADTVWGAASALDKGYPPACVEGKFFEVRIGRRP
jgi:hypothetical protein